MISPTVHDTTFPNVAIYEAGSYSELVDFLTADLDFVRLELGGGPGIAGKAQLFLRLFANTLRLVSHLVLRRRRFDVVVTFSHLGIVVRFLRHIGLIRYRRLYTLAFFFHSPRWLAAVRRLLFDSKYDEYIVFSRQEVDLYTSALNIDRDRLHYLPYCSWSNTAISPSRPTSPPSDDYYFAGGYSNRDYLSLIEAFRHSPARLVIVCSHRNPEVAACSLPSNVQCFYDLPSDLFEAYVSSAKAGIIPLKHDTGASGQSVVLRLMRNRKAVIASDKNAIRDYVEDGVTGFLVRDIAQQLPSLIARLDGAPALAASMGNASYDLFLRRFSRKAGTEALTQILAQS
jgi:glycosyltransferase involved in cell wall biosynthesis